MKYTKYTRNIDGVHLKTPGGNDLTICGDAFEGTCTDDDPEDACTDQPHGPVTCPRCIEIIKQCRGVRIRKRSNYE